jgi:hypothetical protein
MPVSFSAVIICNTNPFNSKYAIDFIQQNVPGANCFNLLNKGLGIYLTVHNQSELIFTLPSG